MTRPSKEGAGGRIDHCTISIVVPNYNHGRFLPQCLAAIQAQTEKPYEVLLIDDASTDDSLDIIDRFSAGLPRFQLVRHRVNQGVVACMNEGLRLASGTHVLGAAADDWIEPELIALSMQWLDRYPNAGICSALSRLANEDGVVTGPFRTPVPRWTAGYITPADAVRHLIRDDTWFNGNTAIVNRAAAIETGGYRPDLASFCDGFLNANLAWQYGACFIPRFLAVWRRLESGYAASVNVDPASMFGIFEAVQRVVLANPSKPIPEAYIKRWAARWRFSAARSAIAAGKGEGRKRLVSLLPPNLHPVVGILEQVTRVPGIGHDVATAFLFLLFRFRDIEPVLRRRLEWMIFGRKLETDW
jgi:glycosyltransferase involved in cell wall biosynthesis